MDIEKNQNFITFKQLLELKDSNNLYKPSFQRPLNDEQKQNIKKYIIKNISKNTFILGIVTLAFKDRKCLIIDGQHRIFAIIELIKENELKIFNLDELKINAEIKYNLTKDECKECFLNINLGISCPMIYLHSIDDYIEEVVNLFNNKFSERLKTSANCSLPNLNLDNIISKLKENIYDGYNEKINIIRYLYGHNIIKTPKDLKKKIKELNNHIENRLKCDDVKNIYSDHAKSLYQVKNLSSFIEKVEKAQNPCYLGIIPNYKWIKMICNHQMF